MMQIFIDERDSQESWSVPIPPSSPSPPFKLRIARLSPFRLIETENFTSQEVHKTSTSVQLLQQPVRVFSGYPAFQAILADDRDVQPVAV